MNRRGSRPGWPFVLLAVTIGLGLVGLTSLFAWRESSAGIGWLAFRPA